MIRIFIGTSPNGEDDIAERTLKYSLERHTSEPVEVIFMRNKEGSYLGKFDNSRWVTPFTGMRWTIPEYCNFSGRAIYMDVDQLNLRDISELYNIDLEGKPFASRQDRLCVMVFDCAAMRGLVPTVQQLKIHSDWPNQNYWRMVSLSSHFDPRWNCLDGEGRPISDIWHLHFTTMPTQPWKPAWFRGQTREHPRRDLVALWEQYRDEAIAAGY
jgi:hypothetical protein